MSSRLKKWQSRWRGFRDSRPASAGVTASPPTYVLDQCDNVTDDVERSFAFVGAAVIDDCDLVSTISRDSGDSAESTGSNYNNTTGSDEEDVDFNPQTKAWDQPLSIDTIRVIDILPAKSGDDSLVYSLRYIKLPEPTKQDDKVAPWMRQPPTREPYFTLSYAWGDTFPDGSHLTHTIVRNGGFMRVTAKLHSVLTQIRRLQRQGRLESHVPIWIDAICINQEDVVERSEQVRQMDRIYQSSEKLLIWLGEVDDVEEEKFLSKLGDICSAYSSNEVDQEDWKRNRLLGRETPFTNEDRRAMLQLLQRAWFKRRWVIQEAYYKSSERRRICLGDFMIHGHHFERALFEMRLSHRAPALERAQPQQRSILFNLQIYHSTRCSDPRDYVYALISISPERRTLAIDYSLSTKEMYFSFAKQHLSIDLLISATTRLSSSSKRPDDLASLPTWVPDWRQPVQYRSPFHENAVHAFLQDSKSQHDPRIQLHPHLSDLILVQGRLITACPNAKACQDFRCACIACRFSRAAIRSTDGVPVVAGLTADIGTPTRRLLLLVNGCSIAFWLERYLSPVHRNAVNVDMEGTPEEQVQYRLTTCVALPQYVSHRHFPALLADVPVETFALR